MTLFFRPLRVLLSSLQLGPHLANFPAKEEVPDDGACAANHHEQREIPQRVIAKTSTATEDENDSREGIFNGFLRQLLGVSLGAAACEHLM